MKTETVDEWKIRTGKEPKKQGYAESYKKVYSHGWLTKSKKPISLKSKGHPSPPRILASIPKTD
jgi:hypothetical protein